ncbi:MAG: DegT/DnrJ/EryC1/StrS family aminotransferase [Candidatus Micrarchaeota archaeon]|nr:DegT/DnrJ/EryC1/StrS family aminotransferase [Candidatus Micrarchaeota archaeon]
MIPIAKPMIGEDEISAVADVMRSGMMAQGPKVKQFEEEFAKYIGTKFAVASSNGTTALHLALLAHGIKAGDEVITTPFTFIASANSIVMCGAKPVFADIGADFNVDPQKIEEKITEKTKAIMPVHLFGLACDMKPIMEIAEKHGLAVIEDACQSHGAEYNGKRVGSFGTGVFSFYPTKNMTTGEGGMITTNDEEAATLASEIRNQGSKQRYFHHVLGYNFRMTDMAAAIGIVQLSKLERFIEARRANAETLTKGLAGLRGIVIPYIPEGRRHVFNQYTVRVTLGHRMNRDTLMAELNRRGIGTGVYYPLPINRQPLYRDMGYEEEMPESEKAASEVLSLPVHPAVTEDNIAFILSVMRELSK